MKYQEIWNGMIQIYWLQETSDLNIVHFHIMWFSDHPFKTNNWIIQIHTLWSMCWSSKKIIISWSPPLSTAVIMIIWSTTKSTVMINGNMLQRPTYTNLSRHSVILTENMEIWKDLRQKNRKLKSATVLKSCHYWRSWRGIHSQKDAFYAN